MTSLAFKFEEITARELKPELYELDGISRATIEAHYKLYQGYVNKRNEILGRLDAVDSSDFRLVAVFGDVCSLDGFESLPRTTRSTSSTLGVGEVTPPV